MDIRLKIVYRCLHGLVRGGRFARSNSKVSNHINSTGTCSRCSYIAVSFARILCSSMWMEVLFHRMGVFISKLRGNYTASCQHSLKHWASCIFRLEYLWIKRCNMSSFAIASTRTMTMRQKYRDCYPGRTPKIHWRRDMTTFTPAKRLRVASIAKTLGVAAIAKPMM